jgi:hypothetical protein
VETKENVNMSRKRVCGVLFGAALLAGLPSMADSMCGYFSRPIVVDLKESRVLQPAQTAFITWDPEGKVETVTVQPRFEGNAVDFGMVIPTPTQPKLHEMPKEFFKALGLYTAPKRRAFAESRLMPRIFNEAAQGFAGGDKAMRAGGAGKGGFAEPPPPTTVKVHEVGIVGNLDYKILSAERPDDLYNWLKDHKYSYSGDEATLEYYVQKKYFFTVMKIDTLQMRRNKDGSYTGDVTPTRFTFTSEKLVYPMKITQISVKDKTEALFYVQAPYKVDLPEDMSYQFHWLSLLQQSQANVGVNDLLPDNQKWLKAVTENSPGLFKRGQELGYSFPVGQPLPANKQGRLPSTLEWAKHLTADDIRVLTGDAPYSETVPDPDFGFDQVDLRDPQRAQAIFKVIQRRLDKAQKDRPRGYLVRDASKEDLKSLPVLRGHLKEGQYLTKFTRTFTKAEMNEDMVMVQAKAGNVEDRSEHEELLRTVIFGGRGFGGRGFGPAPVPPGLPLPIIKQ